MERMVHSFGPVMCCRTTLAGELLWKPSLGTEIYYLGQFCWVKLTNPVVMRSTSDCASDELCDIEQVTSQSLRFLIYRIGKRTPDFAGCKELDGAY